MTATPAAVSPDLDISLTLSKGKETIAYADPPSAYVSTDVASGLDASITATLSPGTYTVASRCRRRQPRFDTGYSDYASVGAYTVTFTTTGT